MKKLSLTVAAVLALAGCATQQNMTKPMYHKHHGHGKSYAQPMATNKTMVYQCDIGLTVHATYPNDSQVKLTIEQGGQNATLDIAPSGSGSRYVSNSGLYGGGGEWHTKGHDAHFTFAGVHGDKKATSCELSR